MKDETGMTMGLVVIMIVLIGVLGAGLLTFVQRNLEGVVEVNKGQKAFETADAGVQAARNKLLLVDEATLTSGATPGLYDGGTGDSDWSFLDRDGAGADLPGRNLTFDGNTVNVQIRYLPPVTAPLTPTQDQAPETIPIGKTRVESGCRYFKVVADGSYGQARRKVEAILCASARGNTARAYYTPKNIELSGNIDVSGVSLFAGGNININGNSVDFDRTTPAVYGDWNTAADNPPSTYNLTPRKNALNQSVVGVGLAAEGRICKQGTCAPDGINDYDSTTTKKFVRKAPADNPSQPANRISYPFDPVDPIDTNFLKEEAQRQGRYYTTRTDIVNSMFPDAPTGQNQTVIYINAQGGDVTYRANKSDPMLGTIVIENGNLDSVNSANDFAGVVVITGNGTTTGQFKNTGNVSVIGFVIADGNMIIRGSVAPLALNEDLFFRPAYYSVNVWSWREMYQ